MYNQSTKPSLLNAVLLAIPLLVVFVLVYLAVSFIIGAIFLLLSYIPIINILLEWLFDTRGDSPEIATFFAAMIFCYHAVLGCADRLCSHNPTKRLLLKITGGALIGFYGLSVLVAIFSPGYEFSQIIAYAAFVIEGFVIYFASGNYPDPKPAEAPKSTPHEPADTYIYLETEGGMTVRVPEDRLDEYADPSRPKPEITPERRAELKAALKQRIYGSDSNQS